METLFKRHKKNKETIVILDTNFLYFPFEVKVDIFEEFNRVLNKFKLVVFDKVIDEIKNNAKGKAVHLLLNKKIDKNEISVIPTKINYIDDAIIDFVKNNYDDFNIIVATQDMALKKRLSEYKVSIIILRKKKYLELVQRASVDV